MRKLKKSIIWIFVLALIALSVIESFVDFLYEEIAIPYYGWIGVQEMIVTTSIYILVSISVIILITWLFSRKIGKKFETEIHRQVEERNILYAHIAHDLKTPMTSIFGYAKALKDKKVEPEQLEMVVDRIYQKAKQADGLLNMLFEYTKLQTNSYQLNKTKVDICAVVRNVVAGQYEAFEDKNIELEIEIPDNNIFVFCDVQQMARAVENLVINAYKHNVAGGHVGVILRKESNGISIAIADNGKNIPVGEIEAIFEPFISLDVSRHLSDGSGLGLAIAKSIIEKHGGKLCIEHRKSGYVKEFVIYLFEAYCFCF